MPVYEYECLACGKALETFQQNDDERLTVCPRCGGELRRLFSPPTLLKASSSDEGATDDPSPEEEAPPAPDIDVPWEPEETDIHRGWKGRRKWKRDMLAAHKWRERDKGKD